MRLAVTIALLALSLVPAATPHPAPTCVGAACVDDPATTVFSGTPRADDVVDLACSAPAAQGCAATGPRGTGAWQIWMSSCADTRDAASCSPLTGRFLVRIHDGGFTPDDVWRAEWAAGAWLEFNMVSGDNGLRKNATTTLTVTPLAGMPLAGAYHAWLTHH